MTLTAERLRELLHYDPLTGIFTWRVNRGRSVKAGEVAGTVHKSGYIQICISGRLYLAHRLAWLYMTGKWPDDEVDHKYGIRHDNRWSELRAATHSGNLQNQRKARSDNKSGLLGVCANKGKWEARIAVTGKQVVLGRFDTPELAHSAYLEAKAKLHPLQTIAPLSQCLADSESKLSRAMKCTII